MFERKCKTCKKEFTIDQGQADWLKKKSISVASTSNVSPMASSPRSEPHAVPTPLARSGFVPTVKGAA